MMTGQLTACDVIGGTSVKPPSPWSKMDRSYLNVERTRQGTAGQPVLRYLRSTDAEGLYGIYQFEYRVCANSFPGICADPVRTLWGAVGIDGLPMRPGGAPTQQSESSDNAGSE